MYPKSGIAYVVRVRDGGVPEDQVVRTAIASGGEPRRIEHLQIQMPGSLRFVFYSRADAIAFKIKLSDMSVDCEIL